MDKPQHNYHEFSRNQLSVSGGDVRVQYGNRHHGKSASASVPDFGFNFRVSVHQNSGPSWGDVTTWIFGTESIFSEKVFQRSSQRGRTADLTGLWFLEGEVFGQWIREPKSFLWLHGKSTYTLRRINYTTYSNRLYSWLWQDDALVSYALHSNVFRDLHELIHPKFVCY